YRLKSTDKETERLMPTTYSDLSFDVPPTDLINGVWTAQTEVERKRIQPAFNEFLSRRRAAARDENKDMRKSICSNKTLFYMSGYALPFLSRAMKDRDPVIREQAVVDYPYAAKA